MLNKNEVELIYEIYQGHKRDSKLLVGVNFFTIENFET